MEALPVEPLKYVIVDCPILKKLCQVMGEPITEVRMKTRFRRYVWVRKVYCFLRWKYEWYYKPTKERTTLNNIGLPVSIDHCTVLHYIEAVRNDMYTYKYLREEVEKYERELLLTGFLPYPPNRIPPSAELIEGLETLEVEQPIEESSSGCA